MHVHVQVVDQPIALSSAVDRLPRETDTEGVATLQVRLWVFLRLRCPIMMSCKMQHHLITTLIRLTNNRVTDRTV